MMFLVIYIPVGGTHWELITSIKTHDQRLKPLKSPQSYYYILKTTSCLICVSRLLNSRMWLGILRIYPMDSAIQHVNNWDLVNSGVNLYYSTKFLTKVTDSKVHERGTQRNHLNGVSWLQMQTFLLAPHLNTFDRVSILLLQTKLHTKYPRNRQRKPSFVVFRPAWNWGYRRKWQCSSF